MDERAFKSYQIALTKYPKVKNYDEILGRQYTIATRYLGGQRFKLFGYIPMFRSMEKTAKMMQEIVGNGPYFTTGPKAQIDTGAAHEKQKNYPQAVKAYEKAADRYFDRPPVASEAIYRAGKAWEKQALRAEYDQSKAGSSIALMQDFMELYPQDSRVPDARDTIAILKIEQSRGAFETGRFYERYKRWQAALVYYNESLQKDPNSPYAEESRRRIELLKPLAEEQIKRVAAFELRIRQRATARATNSPAFKPVQGTAAPAPAGTTNAPVRIPPQTPAPAPAPAKP
jgi:outer membrane protein assembly factor BamD (BamD/ComL family)